MSSPASNASVNVPGLRILEKLGSGSYSTVYKASMLDNPKEFVAVKCIEKANLSSNGKVNIVNEIQIMKLLQHEFVVRLIDFQWDEKYIYLILEYCRVGDLNTFIKRKRRLPEHIFHKFLQQLALGLQFLRSNNVSHFDLKPQNLLLTKCPKLTLKIADFGFAQFLSQDSLKTSIRGSPLYMAPEMLLKQQSSPKADLWSVGIISYQCLFGRPPIVSSTICDIIKSHKNEVPIEIPENVVSEECSDMLSRLLVYDPIVRIDFDEFFNHQFVDLEHYPTDESYSKAVRLIFEGVRLDCDKNYKEAFKIYCQALQYLVPYVKDVDDPVKKQRIQNKVLEYTNRAEELQQFLARSINYNNAKSECIRKSVASSIMVIGSNKTDAESPRDSVAPSDSNRTSLGLEDPSKRQSSQKKVSESTSSAGVIQHSLPRGSSAKTSEAASTRESFATVVHSNKTDSESTSDILSVSNRMLEAMCTSTPDLGTAFEMGKIGFMYLAEKKYEEALEKLKSALSIAIPVIQNEPPGLRKDLLVKQVQEWLTYAENIKVLLTVPKNDKPVSFVECTDACVIQ